MFDVNYYMTGVRNEQPFVYNIETTNMCNMKCVMCPRTTLMTRKVETMQPELFRRIIDQIEPQDPVLWQKWEEFVETKYDIRKDEMSENHFFLYIIPKILQLHGYGEPLLDKNMPTYIKWCTEKGIPTYFSCNPANINIDVFEEMFKNGLTYVKFSVESVYDSTHKAIRGEHSNFTEAYDKIIHLLQNKHNTTIVITMLDLNREYQWAEWEYLKECFDILPVYIYFKSQDTQWLNKNYHGTKSIHWSEPCKHPWMSMTIKSNGEATQCMEDFNNAIVLGDAKKESLYDIWNGERYAKLRQDHLKLTAGIQCTENCDMELVGEYVDCRNRPQSCRGHASM